MKSIKVLSQAGLVAILGMNIVAPNFADAATTGGYTISGDTWMEKDNFNDTKYDKGYDLPIAGVPVTLKTYSGEIIGETVTGNDGTYKFENIPDGKYTVSWHHPLYWQPVIANSQLDANEETDSDGPTDVLVEVNGGDVQYVSQGYWLAEGTNDMIAPNLNDLQDQTVEEGQAIESTISVATDKELVTLDVTGLPEGVTFTPSDITTEVVDGQTIYTAKGTFSGAPLSAGTYNLTITATDKFDNVATDEWNLIVTEKPIPTTEAPTTEAPTTEAPTTETPTTETPTTEAPTTETPTTEAPTTETPTTEAPTTETPTTETPTTETPTTEAPTTEVPTTEVPTTEAPTTEAPTTEAPTTEAPTTEAPTTEVPTTEVPTTEVAPVKEKPTLTPPVKEKLNCAEIKETTGKTNLSPNDPDYHKGLDSKKSNDPDKIGCEVVPVSKEQPSTEQPSTEVVLTDNTVTPAQQQPVQQTTQQSAQQQQILPNTGDNQDNTAGLIVGGVFVLAGISFLSYLSYKRFVQK